MRFLRLAFFMSAFASLAVHARELPLRQVLEAGDGWVGYEVPIVDGAGSPCCFAGRDGARDSGGATSMRVNGVSAAIRVRPVVGRLAVYWHVANGRIDKVRAVAAACTMRSATPIRKLSRSMARRA